ncbi:hypothetical protein IJI72_02240 [Candidatus Saccharibacteria bacterium]|nr:hypothetical protein [Candidatus Saccharibacteria bacterium]
MVSFVFLGLILFGTLLLALLQLPLGTLLLLYHSVLGRPNSRKNSATKVRPLVSYYLAGVALADFLLLAAACFLVSALSAGALSATVLRYLIFLLLLGLSLFILLFYYRRSSPVRSTELWLPRLFARFLDARAKATHNLPEAFSLGFSTVLFELPFSLPLFLVSAVGLLSLTPSAQLLALFLFTVLAVAPLLVLRLKIRSGKNLADAQRWRLKNRDFLRFLTGFGFFVLACFFFAFFLLGVGGV